MEYETRRNMETWSLHSKWTLSFTKLVGCLQLGLVEAKSVSFSIFEAQETFIVLIIRIQTKSSKGRSEQCTLRLSRALRSVFEPRWNSVQRKQTPDNRPKRMVSLSADMFRDDSSII